MPAIGWMVSGSQPCTCKGCTWPRPDVPLIWGVSTGSASLFKVWNTCHTPLDLHVDA